MLQFIRKLFKSSPEPKGQHVIAQTGYGPMIVNAHDAYVGRDILRYGVWQRNEIETLLKLARFLIARHGAITAYDIGANFGMHSLALGRTFGPAITIRAFEAQEPVFNMLCGTLALNGLQNVHCHCNAVAAEAGQVLRLNLPDYDVTNNLGSFEVLPALRSDNNFLIRSGRIQEVKTLTVDSFAEPVHLMKIDVEGMEGDVLRGAAKTIAAHRPVCHVEILKGDARVIHAFFAQHNFLVLPNGADALAIPAEMSEELAQA